MKEQAFRWASWAGRVPYLLGVVFGGMFEVCFRLIAYFSSGNRNPDRTAMGVTEVMTVAFLVLGPVALGYITVYFEERARPRSVWSWIFSPWIAMTLGTSVICLLHLEGFICVLFALPLLLLFSAVGGVMAGLLTRTRTKKGPAPMVCVAILPLLLAPVESLIKPPMQIRTVETDIRIHAPEATVWRNIERVRAIAPEELRPTWAHAIGFPRPVEATLSHEGVGGVRHASFERGLMFIETITQWEQNRDLAFSIKADTDHIPPGTLDEHVTIGGRYFDVLDGEYRLEKLPGGDVLLHLSSRERLSTDFNEYAGFWTDAVMTTLQKSILEVVKKRCENEP